MRLSEAHRAKALLAKLPATTKTQLRRESRQRFTNGADEFGAIRLDRSRHLVMLHIGNYRAWKNSAWCMGSPPASGLEALE